MLIVEEDARQLALRATVVGVIGAAFYALIGVRDIHPVAPPSSTPTTASEGVDFAGIATLIAAVFLCGCAQHVYRAGGLQGLLLQVFF